VGNGPFKLREYVGELTSEFDPKPAVVSHNPLLEVCIDTGVFGMLVYASICIAGLWQFFRFRHHRCSLDLNVSAYYAIVFAVAIGYFASWIKAGGMEHHPIFFVLLGLLVIPQQLSLGVDSSDNVPADPLALTRGEPGIDSYSEDDI
jgi:hypothetical protein